jgi:hypothetical protein
MHTQKSGSAMIEVKPTGHDPVFEFEVVVREQGSLSRHHVTLEPGLWQRLVAGQVPPERVLKSAFAFLLDREPKEAILRRFDLSVISRYFPEFEHELPRYLAEP